MPMNRALYPDNWDSIAQQVKAEADWTCEACGRTCRKPGESQIQFMARIQTARLSECLVIQEYLAHPKRWVLTVAHLDHRPENCDRSNLKALCAPCHCRYDLSQMARKKRLKAERHGQLTMLD